MPHERPKVYTKNTTACVYNNVYYTNTEMYTHGTDTTYEPRGPLSARIRAYFFVVFLSPRPNGSPPPPGYVARGRYDNIIINAYARRARDPREIDRSKLIPSRYENTKIEYTKHGIRTECTKRGDGWFMMCTCAFLGVCAHRVHKYIRGPVRCGWCLAVWRCTGGGVRLPESAGDVPLTSLRVSQRSL